MAERIRAELGSLESVVRRAADILGRLASSPGDEEYLLAAAALDLHGFYTGIERLFTAIASDVDGARPTGLAWHRNLLAQMALSVPEVRPPVISAATVTSLMDYLEFRHVVRNVYAYNLRGERVTGLLQQAPTAFGKVREELLDFAAFLQRTSHDGPSAPA